MRQRPFAIREVVAADFVAKGVECRQPLAYGKMHSIVEETDRRPPLSQEQRRTLGGCPWRHRRCRVGSLGLQKMGVHKETIIMGDDRSTIEVLDLCYHYVTDPRLVIGASVVRMGLGLVAMSRQWAPRWSTMTDSSTQISSCTRLLNIPPLSSVFVLMYDRISYRKHHYRTLLGLVRQLH